MWSFRIGLKGLEGGLCLELIVSVKTSVQVPTGHCGRSALICPGQCVWSVASCPVVAAFKNTDMGGYSALMFLVSVATVAKGYVVLEEKSYIQLNDANGQKTINASTYNRLAFDFGNNILYNTAKEPGRLTAFSLLVDGTPNLLKEVVFDTALKGQPLDVEFCQPRAVGGVARLAISFEDPNSASADGTVRLYQPLTPLGGNLDLIKEITVGALPVDIEFGEDCNVMLVANKGRPTREASNAYRDPEGTVTKILMPFDLSINSPITTTTISFAGLFTGPGSFEYLQLLREGNFRYYPLRQPDGTLLTIMQNIEPDNLVVAPNGLTAYVSLPKNNAIARLNLETNQVSSIFPLGNRSWTDYYMDPSDNDGEVNMRGYNIYSFFQATEMQWVVKEGREWLLTIDTGVLNDIPEYSYSDYQRGRILASNGAIMVADSELDAQLKDDTELGRLAVSVEDGKREDGIIADVFTFGGRGFSIHNANNFDTPTAIVDSIEQVTKQYYPAVFNTAYLTDSSTPQSDREATSPFLGPNLSAMEVGEFDDKTVVFFGGGSSGILYVYMLAPDAVCPQPYFHSIHRRGSTFSSWAQAYQQGSMGDIGINDIKYVKNTNLAPTLIVASSASNSVSFYSVVEAPFGAVTK